MGRERIMALEFAGWNYKCPSMKASDKNCKYFDKETGWCINGNYKRLTDDLTNGKFPIANEILKTQDYTIIPTEFDKFLMEQGRKYKVPCLSRDPKINGDRFVVKNENR